MNCNANANFSVPNKPSSCPTLMESLKYLKNNNRSKEALVGSDNLAFKNFLCMYILLQGVIK